MAEGNTSLPPAPESQVVVRKRGGFSVVWIVPIIAAAAGIWVAVSRIMSEGPKITITFASADGLEAGKTKIRYKGVEVGTLTSIRLSIDHQQVVATAQMAPNTRRFLLQDTQFWVVRPRISGANVTGLGTLISGAYVGMAIGRSHKERRDFVGLEAPPVIAGAVAGRFFLLKTSNLGSLDYGTPIFFRRLQVGRVASYRLNSNGEYFSIKVFIKDPYDQFVTVNSRFWHASGIDMQLSANGLSVRTQSLLSMMIGGIALETPDSPQPQSAAPENSVFTLYTNRAQAFAPPPRNPQTYKLIFNQSVHGLLPGAPVEFRGIKIGEVTDIVAQVDARTLTFSVPVTIHLDPRSLGIKLLNMKSGSNLAVVRRKLFDSLIAHGVRAQLRTGNLLTGSAYVAFDFFPDVPPMKIDWSQSPVELPTIPGQLQTAEAKLNNIIDRLDQLPLKDIANNANKTLGDLDLTLLSARGTLERTNKLVGSADSFVAADSAERQELDNTLHELSRAAVSMRVLADYLERHPEALVRGKKGDSQ